MAKQNNLKPENLKPEENSKSKEDTKTEENTKPNDDLSFETKPYTENSVIGGNETSHGVAAHGLPNQKAYMIQQLHTSQQAHANQQLAGGSKHGNTIPVHHTPYDHLTPKISNTNTINNQIHATKNHANVVNNQRSTCGADGAVCNDLLSNESQTGGSKKNSKKTKKSSTKKINKNKKNYKNSKKSKKNKKNQKNKKTKKNQTNKKTMKNRKIKGILKKTKNNKNKNKKVRFN